MFGAPYIGHILAGGRKHVVHGGHSLECTQEIEPKLLLPGVGQNSIVGTLSGGCIGVSITLIR